MVKLLIHFELCLEGKHFKNQSINHNIINIKGIISQSEERKGRIKDNISFRFKKRENNKEKYMI